MMHKETKSTTRHPLSIIRQQELAKMLGVTVWTVIRMMNAGELPPRVKVSSRIKGWKLSDIEEWIHNNQEAPNQKVN
jgi:predicted DNA-binding transcriptional regulator AlpA